MVLPGITQPKCDPQNRTIFWTTFWLTHVLEGPVSGPLHGPKNGDNNICIFHFQALAVWQWSNFLHHQVAQNKKPLHINMDETSVRLYPVMRAGNITYAARLKKRSPKSLTANVTRGQMRGTMSLICFVCDDPEVQKDLPQILLVKKQYVPAYTWPAIRAAIGSPLTLWVVNNAWMTSEMMIKVLRHVKTCLHRWQTTHQIVLSADAYKAHISPTVWRRAAAMQMMYHVIPAKMTWALQPCDTHVFSKLKHHISNELQKQMVRSPTGKPTVLMAVTAVNRAIHAVVVTGSWVKAFEDLGLNGNQNLVSTACLARLNLHDHPHVGHAIPTLTTLLHVFPGRSQLPIDDMFRIFLDREAAQQPMPMFAADNDVYDHRDESQPWLGRLRSSSSLQQLPHPTPPVPPPCPPPPPLHPPTPAQHHPVLRREVPRARRLLPWLPRPRPPDTQE